MSYRRIEIADGVYLFIRKTVLRFSWIMQGTTRGDYTTMGVWFKLMNATQSRVSFTFRRRSWKWRARLLLLSVRVNCRLETYTRTHTRCPAVNVFASYLLVDRCVFNWYFNNVSKKIKCQITIKPGEKQL